MKKAACRRGADVVYWCIANFPICYSLNIRYTYTHNEYWAGKTKTDQLRGPFVHMSGVSRWRDLSDESMSICNQQPAGAGGASLGKNSELTSTVAYADWFLTAEKLLQRLKKFCNSEETSLLCHLVWCLQQKLLRKNKYKKVVLITNYQQVLKTNNRPRLYSFVFIEKCIFGKSSERKICRTNLGIRRLLQEKRLTRFPT